MPTSSRRFWDTLTAAKNRVSCRHCLMVDVSFRRLGADLVCGGNRLGDKGYYIEPTVFANVRDEMKIAREEIFGPVQSILKFRDTDDVFVPVVSIAVEWRMSFQVIRRANDSPYGLAAGILCNDINTVNRVSRSLRAGEPVLYTQACIDEFFTFYRNGVGQYLPYT